MNRKQLLYAVRKYAKVSEQRAARAKTSDWQNWHAGRAAAYRRIAGILLRSVDAPRIKKQEAAKC